MALKEEASAAAPYLAIFFRRPPPATRSMHTNGCNVQADEDELITTASNYLHPPFPRGSELFPDVQMFTSPPSLVVSCTLVSKISSVVVKRANPERAIKKYRELSGLPLVGQIEGRGKSAIVEWHRCSCHATTATAAAIKLPVMAPYHSEWNCSSIHRRDRPTDRPTDFMVSLALSKCHQRDIFWPQIFPSSRRKERRIVGRGWNWLASSSSWGDRENRSSSVPIKSRRTSKQKQTRAH